MKDTTLEVEYTYRTVGKVRRPFTPIHTHYSHTVRTVVASYSQLFSHYSRAHYSHGLTLFEHCSHGRKLFAHYSHGRTRFARSHTIRTRFAHYSRGSHTIRAIVSPNSHTIRTSSHPRSHYSRSGGEPVRTHSRSIRTVHNRSHL